MELTKFAGRGRGTRKYERVERRTGTAHEEQPGRSGRDAHC